jgi:hypothetical protein
MDPSGSKAALDDMLARIRAEVDKAQSLADERFDVYVSTNLRVLEEGNWKDYTHQPKTCHMQALRQVLTPTGLFNCPAHRGVEKAKVADVGSFKDEASACTTTAGLATLLDEFDARHECREVTCLYNKVNWWLEEQIEGEGDLAPSPERMDGFL